MSGHFNLLLTIGGRTWGWHILDCHQVYITIVRSMLEYAAVAWAPLLSATSNSKLEKVQLEAARDITDLVRSTPVEAVLAISQLPPISTRLKTITHLKPDEWDHLPPADDCCLTFFTACRQRLKRKDWYNTRFLRLNQHGFNPHVLAPTSPPVSSFPFHHGTNHPLSQQSSHQLTREYHHPSREIFIFKPLPPFP